MCPVLWPLLGDIINIVSGNVASIVCYIPCSLNIIMVCLNDHYSPV